MKKLISVLVITLCGFLVKANEGMWLVQLIGEKTYADMVKTGLTLSKEQLYSINKSSIKDAILFFGGGCTAEVVSKEGLVFTNHHCGYGSIAAASSVAHNYLKDGFWAKSKQEEIASPGLSVQFLIQITDVTDKVNEKIKTIPTNELAAKLPAILTEMSSKAADGTGYEIRIASFFKGNQFLQFTYQRYTDVRLVGTPPESIGKFGGDSDNWEWPRHTGDFSVFRIYMNKNGKPADYSADNIPYVPKYFLPISLKGINDGDFSMIFGYPGSTNRYETSFGVKLKIDIENPFTVSLRDARLKLMMTEMLKDPANKIQLASYYAQVANYWKFYQGETKQLIKYNVFEQKQKDEAAFEAWAKGKPEYDNLFADIKKAYDNWRPYAKQRVYISEGILGSPLLAFASSLKVLKDSIGKTKPENLTKIIEDLKTAYETFIKSENIASDRNIFAIVTQLFYTDIDPSQRPQLFYNMLKTTYGPLEKDETYEKFAKQVFEKTFLLNKAKWDVFIAKPDTVMLNNDLAYQTIMSFSNNFNTHFGQYFSDFTGATYALNKKYLKGVLDMKKGQELYPDANRTMRVSYGTVKSYTPKDGINYNYLCTLNGLLEKYVPNDYEFDAPAKLLDLIKAKDYGQYLDKKTNDVVVSFITTDDITGGNSGSPVLNAKGELIGLAFDGNYEALSHKIAFDKKFNRTICVDIRFVLFIIDKLGGAKNLIDELVISKN